MKKKHIFVMFAMLCAIGWSEISLADVNCFTQPIAVCTAGVHIYNGTASTWTVHVISGGSNSSPINYDPTNPPVILPNTTADLTFSSNFNWNAKTGPIIMFNVSQPGTSSYNNVQVSALPWPSSPSDDIPMSQEQGTPLVTCHTIDDPTQHYNENLATRCDIMDPTIS